MKKVQKQKRWAGSGLAPPPAFRDEVRAPGGGGRPAGAGALGDSPPAPRGVEQRRDTARPLLPTRLRLVPHALLSMACTAARVQVAALAGGGEGAGPDLQRFAQLLLGLLDQRNAYAEIEAIKPLAACAVECGTRAAGEGGGGDQQQQQQQPQPQQQQQQQQQREADLLRMQALLARLLLLPNARPLHKPLLAGLRPLLERQRQQQEQQEQQGAAVGDGQFSAAAAACCADLARECLQLQVQQSGSSGSAGSAKQAEQELLQRSLRLGSALAALLATPTCKPALVACTVPAVAALAAGLQAALQPAAAGGASSRGGAAGAAAVGVAAADAEGAAAAAAAAAAETEHITTDVMEGLQDCSESRCLLLRTLWTGRRGWVSSAAAAQVAGLQPHALRIRCTPLPQSRLSTSFSPLLGGPCWSSSQRQAMQRSGPLRRRCWWRCRGRRWCGRRLPLLPSRYMPRPRCRRHSQQPWLAASPKGWCWQAAAASSQRPARCACCSQARPRRRMAVAAPLRRRAGWLMRSCGRGRAALAPAWRPSSAACRP